MAKEINKTLRLGLFVFAGTVLLILALYFIGSKQNLFGSTFIIKAQFRNVSGLTRGNNVRFFGIDVGTVQDVDIVNDSAVIVEMIIEENVKPFIKKNSIAIIGTDGLMGNKLININPSSLPSPVVEDGDFIATASLVGADDLLGTLKVTNENVREITNDLKQMVKKINRPNSLWDILLDTTLADNVKQSIVNIKVTSEKTALLTGDLSRIVNDVKSGKGTVGALLVDTTLYGELHQSIVNIKWISDSFAIVSGDLKYITSNVKDGKGAVGTLIMDTVFANNLKSSMENIKNGSKGFEENMEGMKHSFLLRRYFRNQTIEKDKEAQKNK